MVILLSFVGCTDEREPQTIDICIESDPLTQASAEGERNKNHEGKKGKWTGPRRIDVGEGDLYAPGVDK